MIQIFFCSLMTYFTIHTTPKGIKSRKYLKTSSAKGSLQRFQSLHFVFCLQFILLFLYKVASGQLKDLDDIREYDVADKMENDLRAKQLAANGG